MDLSQILVIPSFKGVNFSFFISRPVLFVILFLYFCVYFILSMVLMYHWRAYGMKSSGILVAEGLYIFVSIVLFVLAGVSMSYF